MHSDVKEKLKRGNKILFTRDSSCLQKLIRLVELQKHRTLVMWAFECAEIPLNLLEAKYPSEQRPRIAIECAKAWARGDLKMPAAKKAILDAHAVAKEIEDEVYIALCHAIGHAGATVHVETHALGLVFYELSAIVLLNGKENFDLAVNEKIDYYYDRLLYWQKNIDTLDVPWSKFLLDDTRPNKEKSLLGRLAKGEDKL